MKGLFLKTSWLELRPQTFPTRTVPLTYDNLLKIEMPCALLIDRPLSPGPDSPEAEGSWYISVTDGITRPAAP